MKQVIRPAARRDLRRIWEYIARDNIDAADRFLSACQATIEQIAAHPMIGHAGSWRRHARVRSLVVKGFGNYLVFYVPHKDSVEVKRILHGMRNLPTLFRL